MAVDPQEFARLLGAEIVGEVPDVGGGPFGMARLARLMHQRLSPSQGERPGRPTNPNWATRCKVPMSNATLGKLTELADHMSTRERKVSPMQVAAQLLEEALSQVGGDAVVTSAEVASTLEPASGTDAGARGSGPLTVEGKEGSPSTPIKFRVLEGDRPQGPKKTQGHRRKKA